MLSMRPRHRAEVIARHISCVIISRYAGWLGYLSRYVIQLADFLVRVSAGDRGPLHRAAPIRRPARHIGVAACSLPFLLWLVEPGLSTTAWRHSGIQFYRRPRDHDTAPGRPGRLGSSTADLRNRRRSLGTWLFQI